MELKFKYFIVNNKEELVKLLLILNLFSNIRKKSIENLLEIKDFSNKSLIYLFDNYLSFHLNYNPEASFMNSCGLFECTLEELLTYEQ